MSKITAAFEGREGAHSDLVLQAYLRAMGIDFETTGVSTFRQVASAVMSDKSDIGIIPIDNAIDVS